MKKYKFVGSGACVPGLPHEITDQEIDQFNEAQLDVWLSALASGQYQDVSVEPVKTPRISESKVVAHRDVPEGA